MLDNEEEVQKFSEKEITEEANRLFSELNRLNYNFNDCLNLASLTLEINKLKKKDAVILAHYYMPIEIIVGVADFVSDSLFLAKKAKTVKQKTIVFCGVHFMAETAKILNPSKNVLLPDLKASCSLAESINVEQLKKLKEQHPSIPIVIYVNYTAKTKALSDSVCTSNNVLDVINSFEEKEIIFVPDLFMGKNIQKQTDKKLFLWNGKCIVHELFKQSMVKRYKDLFPGIKVLSHLECNPEVVALSDYVGGTKGMRDFIKNSDSECFLVLTES